MTAQPVLIGPVPLLYVQNIVMTEGYQIQRIADSPFSQAIAPTRQGIAIEAVLLGPDRLLLKKELEALALTSRLLVAATAPALAVTGIPVVCGLTISLDMQITDLRFTQSAQKRDAIDVSITLEHVPRSTLSALLGELGDLALAAGTALAGGPAVPSGVPSVPSIPL
ncbi:hypothetical protein IU500_20925 [Nocardia terpenica]|uniref:Uncharacterized protein n=1 Tax=Nocardia terpenica TaxID=455432 RepID=A0A164MCH3_9NOCA|nr:hypothetical protein [Nocardia terpenica]KZM73234.1 hypothetical protein AWN90_31645 [Nocardia terpenica]MBF6064167.1 hypothetical protein [Nocardia terpenica]MBF6106500.1 hypothetical protein [Nocardia terpenica]MBF6113785.1 hypothetical protein [Nocardia terpenica]MBF6120591.1 hypothetical protein [Nocardia terpenica]